MATKEFIESIGTISSLKVSMNYFDPSHTMALGDLHNGENPEIKLNRYFNNIDGEYVVIFDDIINIGNSSNKYCNQLHFEEYDQGYNGANPQILTTSPDGQFELVTEGTPDIRLYGILSSIYDFDIQTKENLPIGLYEGNYISGNYKYQHRSFRIINQNTITNDEQFLTVLIPTDNGGSDPIVSTYRQNDIYQMIEIDNSLVYDNGTDFTYWCSINTTPNDPITITTGRDVIVTDNRLLGIKLSAPNVIDAYVFSGGTYSILNGDTIFFSDEPVEYVMYNSNAEKSIIKTKSGINPSKMKIFSNASQGVEVNGQVHSTNLVYISDGYAYYGYPLQGTLTRDLLLTVSKDVIGDLSVPDGISLVLSNGSAMNVNPFASITIEGDLIIDGNSNNPVEIIPAYNNWGWEEFNVINADLDIKHLNISGADKIWFQNTNGSILNSSFLTDEATVVEGGSIYIDGSSFQSSGYGLVVASMPGQSRDNVSCENSIFSNSSIGLVTTYLAITRLRNNIFTNNSYGIHSDGFSEPWMWQEDLGLTCNGGNNLIYGNTVGILIREDAQPWLGIYTDLMTDFEGHNRIYNNDSDILNMSWHDRPIYAQVNDWIGGNGCGFSIPENIIGSPVIWEPTAHDLYWDGTTWDPPYPDIDPIMEEAKGDYEDAITIYEGIISDDPNIPKALWALAGIARCHEKLNQLQELIDLFEGYTLTYPNTEVEKYARNYGITAQMIKGDYPKAETMIASFEYDYPNSQLAAKLAYESVLLEELRNGNAKLIGGEESTKNSITSLKYQKIAQEYPETGYGIIAKLKTGNNYKSDENTIVPDSYHLYSNYPNPFNPITNIMFDLPERSQVNLVIYDLMGREIKRLVYGVREAGNVNVTWKGRDSFDKNVASGMYLVYLIVKSLESNKTFTDKKKMILLK